MVKGHHLQLRSHPPLLYNFKQFNIKAAVAHHPIIKKEVDQLLAKGATEPSSAFAGFPSNVFLYLSILVVSGPYIILSSLIIICTSLLLKCLLSDMYGNYSLHTEESYGPIAQHMQDCPIFFIQMNFVHNNKEIKK